ncbi:Cytochrome c oxidase subunit 6A [Malassezia vespertilionis]|uniref:Cox13p n=1 Tax=Malassezia vespertilionis TaxID=2020962 RepID=A0A2N1JCP5_9BASI|nr:Cytochrome c oxidase subunit 6A [Malassezia vespertilionis]PKI84315.1 Cox13p [Malassezia vespertilionis]WFD06285.1 Cytochrome c oxidase subunit 6A [Malassezia vespertilionis]
MSMFRVMLPRTSLAARVARPALPMPMRALSTQNIYWKENRAAAEEFVGVREHAAEHAAGSTQLWRRVTVYILAPLCVVFGVYMYRIESAHAAHHEHELEENGGELPERPDYEYLNMRATSFPWGRQTLFFNPKVNYPAGEA